MVAREKNVNNHHKKGGNWALSPAIPVIILDAKSCD